MATRASNIGKLAGAIAAQMREHKLATISAVGPEASYNAVKATVISTKYLAETLKGDRLAIIPEKMDIANNEDGPATVGLTLHVRQVPPVQCADEPEIFCAGNTNVGLMAGLMVNRFQNDSVVTVGGMGAKATSSALKATMIAQGYMQEALGDTHALGLLPSMNEFEEHNEQRVRMLLGCTKVLKP